MLGSKLRAARLTAEMTQEQLAIRAKVSREYVSQLERDLKSPTVDVLFRLCRAMKTSAGRLLMEIENEPH